MKILVLVEAYPNNNGGRALMYVHTRNIYYVKHGIEVDVINFSAKERYCIDNIQVLTEKDYALSDKKYDTLVLHAANIRHHYHFLKKHGDDFDSFIFFYHGHEVLKCNKVYSTPYPYIKKSKLKIIIQDLYDDYKLRVWREYLPKIIDKSHFIFVSNWMLEQFEKWTGISRDTLQDKYSITYNCVGYSFEMGIYDDKQEKEYDFITVRGNLDDSKYAIDIVNKLAFDTPSGRFLLVGKGEFFNHFKKAPNLDWINSTMNHSEIIEALNKSKFALMPTRTDAQGLMMCEMAAFGMPVITSDIPVCHEVFCDFDNAYFINNDAPGSLDSFLGIQPHMHKDNRYYEDNTARKELQIILNGK